MSTTSSTLSQIRCRIQDYAGEQYLHEKYQDHLSGNRTRLFTPQWPPLPASYVEPPATPAISNSPEAILERIVDPFIQWIRQSDAECQSPRAQILQSQVTCLLDRNTRVENVQAREYNSNSRSFLYRNLPDAGVELNVRQLVNRIHLEVQEKDLSTAKSLIYQALSLSDALNYNPIGAKCWYWAGVVADLENNHEEAVKAFFKALPCFGKYIEGEHLPTYVRKYQDRIRYLIEEESSGDDHDAAKELLESVMKCGLPRPTTVHAPPLQAQRDYQRRNSQQSIDSGDSDSQKSRPLSVISNVSSLFAELLGQIRTQPANPKDYSDTENPDQSESHLDLSRSLPSPRRPDMTKEEILKLYRMLPPEDRKAIRVHDFIDGHDNDPNDISTVAFRVIAATLVAGNESKEEVNSSVEQPTSSSTTRLRRKHIIIPEDRLTIIDEKPRSKAKRMLDPRINGTKNSIELEAKIAEQNATRAERIHVRGVALKKRNYSARVIRGLEHAEELNELRSLFGKDIADPHVQAYRDLTSADLDTPWSPPRTRTNAQMELLMEQQRRADSQHRRGLRQDRLAREAAAAGAAAIVESGKARTIERRRSVSADAAAAVDIPLIGEIVLSDTPALKEIETYPDASTTQRRRRSSVVRWLLGGNGVQIANLESPTHTGNEPASPSPLRKASLPGDDGSG